ncbi:MAG: DUF721 domain-containing protein [Actinomycetota bacterium]|nr:DUF721 domain-containing protein [Actinomycetota bacterium]
MSRDKDLEPFSESIDDVFSRLGLPDPVLMSHISEEWEILAGQPWVGRSKPLYVRGKTLVIEASSPSMIAFLKYGEASLLEALRNRFRPGEIEAIEVVPPGRS